MQVIIHIDSMSSFGVFMDTLPINSIYCTYWSFGKFDLVSLVFTLKGGQGKLNIEAFHEQLSLIP